MNRPTIVDIYCRVSTDPQENNTSLKGQESDCRAFCRENSLTVGMVHAETFSGYVYREREKLSLMRQRYREGKIQGIVIRTLDRLSRNQTHTAVLLEEMEHYDIPVYCVKEKIDNSAMGKFVVAALALIAEMEREKILDRTTTGRINAAKGGKIVSGNKAPYGWAWQYEKDPVTGKVTNKEIVIHEEQAAIVRWLAEQYANGVGAYNLRNQLNERGVPSPNGIEWNDNTIVRLLSDRRITGKNAKLFAYQKRKTKKPLEPIDLPDGTYPALISEELFAAVLERRDANRAYAARANKSPEEYLLRAGFVKCGYCNTPMAAIKHRQNHIYRCTHTDRQPHKGERHRNAILSNQLDAAIWQWLQQLADHIDLIEKAVELTTSENKLQKDTEAIEKSIQIWKAKAQNYLSDLDDGNLIVDTRAAVRNALNNANKMIVELQEERALIMAGMINKDRERQAYQELLAWCKKVKNSREELTYQQKRDFLKMLGVVVIVENVTPYYEHLEYRVEITLPTIQALIGSRAPINCDTSSSY